MKRKKQEDGFGVGQCSLCEQYALTFGQQKHGGVRYCQDCFRETLAYVQLKDDERATLKRMWAALAVHPRIVELLKQAAAIPDDVRKASSIGESRYRLMMAERLE